MVGMLQHEVSARLTAELCIDHPYFDGLVSSKAKLAQQQAHAAAAAVAAAVVPPHKQSQSQPQGSRYSLAASAARNSRSTSGLDGFGIGLRKLHPQASPAAAAVAGQSGWAGRSNPSGLVLAQSQGAPMGLSSLGRGLSGGGGTHSRAQAIRGGLRLGLANDANNTASHHQHHHHQKGGGGGNGCHPGMGRRWNNNHATPKSTRSSSGLGFASGGGTNFIGGSSAGGSGAGAKRAGARGGGHAATFAGIQGLLPPLSR